MKTKTAQLLSRSVVALLLALVLGGLIWALSPEVTGKREPWDAGSGYYIWALLMAVFLPGCIHPARFWKWAVSACIGQWAGLAVSIIRSSDTSFGLLPFGMIFIVFASVMSLAGAAIGAGLHVLIRRLVLPIT